VIHHRQFSFCFPYQDDYDPSALLCGDANAEARAWLEESSAWPGLRLAIHGERGTGKTHLLHWFAACHGATLLPAEAVRGLVPLPTHGAIAIDDADMVPDPEALLHVLNGAAERNMPVLLAGVAPPASWPDTLPDLDSRLRAMTAVGIGRPEDSLLRALLARLMADRQLQVDEAVQDYLLIRLPRSGAALREAAARLDHMSLASGGRISRKTASDMLAGLGADFFDSEDFVPQSSPPSLQGPCLL
jgi:chromosomal replication initiation ATPase DnaA